MTQFRPKLLYVLLPSACVIAAAYSPAPSRAPAVASQLAEPNVRHGTRPLYFERNQGQADPHVKFLARAGNQTLMLSRQGAALRLTRPEGPDSKKGITATVGLHFEGAAANPRITGLEQLPGKVNYFSGSDSKNWRTNIPTFARVHYSQVYPGIDLAFYGNDRNLEYDLIVAPGANPRQIALRISGADHVSRNAFGDLILHTAAGDVLHQKPFAYQTIDGFRHEVAANYLLDESGLVRFEIANYERALPLVIDPVLQSADSATPS